MNYINIILGKILQMFSRLEFQRFVRGTGAEYHTRGFKQNRYTIS